MSCQLVKNNSLWAVWTWLLYALPPWKLLVWEGIMPPSCWNTLLAREPLRVGPVLSSQWWWDCSSIPSNTQQVSVNQLVRERVCEERNTQTPEQILVFVLWAWYLPSLLLTTEPNWASLSVCQAELCSAQLLESRTRTDRRLWVSLNTGGFPPWLMRGRKKISELLHGEN